jgi:hypothetical protein
MQLTVAAVTPHAEHAARGSVGAAAAAAVDAGVIYTRYLVDKYALIMHTYAHENYTEHTGSPSEESGPVDGCSREDIIGAFGA